MISARPGNRTQAGLSLVELMIALLLGIIIVAGLSQIFVSISRSSQEMAKTSSQIENARFAMQFLQNDILHAGYWGGFLPQWDNYAWEVDPSDTPTLTLPGRDPCLPFSTPWSSSYVNSVIGIPVEVFSVSPGTCALASLQSDTDIVIVRHAENCAAGIGNCDAPEANALYFRASNCNGEITSGAPYSLLDPNDISTELDCSTPVAKRKWVQNIYYIRDHAVTPGDGIPTLMRSSFGVTGSTPAQQAGEELVEGIERFHVEVGLDKKSHNGGDVDYGAAIDWFDENNRILPQNRGDGVAEGQFQRCLSNSGCTLTDLASVVAVKLYVLARATEPTAGYTDEKKYTLGSGAAIGPFNDAYKRHVFSTTIRLNNVSGRRDTPYDPNIP